MGDTWDVETACIVDYVQQTLSLLDEALAADPEQCAMVREDSELRWLHGRNDFGSWWGDGRSED